MDDKAFRIDVGDWRGRLDEAGAALDEAFDRHDEKDTEESFNELSAAYLGFMERAEELDGVFRDRQPTLDEFKLYRDVKERVEDYTRGYFLARGEQQTITALSAMFLAPRE